MLLLISREQVDIVGGSYLKQVDVFGGDYREQRDVSGMQKLRCATMPSTQ